MGEIILRKIRQCIEKHAVDRGGYMRVSPCVQKTTVLCILMRCFYMHPGSLNKLTDCLEKTLWDLFTIGVVQLLGHTQYIRRFFEWCPIGG